MPRPAREGCVCPLRREEIVPRLGSGETVLVRGRGGPRLDDEYVLGTKKVLE